MSKYKSFDHFKAELIEQLSRSAITEIDAVITIFSTGEADFISPEEYFSHLEPIKEQLAESLVLLNTGKGEDPNKVSERAQVNNMYRDALREVEDYKETVANLTKQVKSIKVPKDKSSNEYGQVLSEEMKIKKRLEENYQILEAKQARLDSIAESMKELGDAPGAISVILDLATTTIPEKQEQEE